MTDSATALRDGCVAACRACPHRSWTEVASVKQKADFLAHVLEKWASVIEPVQSVTGEARWGYRARTKLGARWTGTTWEFGMEPRDDFIPMLHCPIHAPLIDEALALIALSLPGPEKWPVRYYFQSGTQITLILKNRDPLDPSWITPELGQALAECGITGLWAHQHPAAGRILFSKNGWELLWGARETFCASSGLWHGPQAFQQLIPSLHRQSVDRVTAFFGLQGGEAVVDFYAGLGATSAVWRQHGAEVIAVETDAESCAFLPRNAPGTEVLRGPCAQRLPQVRSWLSHRPHTRHIVYANPPRLGLEPEVTAWLCETESLDRLAILSCSPGTLCRDLTLLCAANWTVESLIPFDFFPQTRHIETLTLLSRR